MLRTDGHDTALFVNSLATANSGAAVIDVTSIRQLQPLARLADGAFERGSRIADSTDCGFNVVAHVKMTQT